MDLRHAVRALRRNMLFTASTVMTLGLGIGVVTGFFAIVNAVVLAPIAAHDDPVVRIWKHDAERNIDRFPLSYPELTLWRERARSFRAIAAISYHDTTTAAVVLGSEVLPVTIAPVSADFFAVLHGGAPLFGRWFQASDEGNVIEMAVVVSERFWRRVSGGDPSFVGRRLSWPGGARSFHVVGVAPAALDYPTRTDLWVPIDGYLTNDGGIADLGVHSRRLANFNFVGRLAAGVSVEQARSELDIVNRGVVSEFPADYRVMPVIAEPLLNASLGTLRPLTVLLFAAAALVFLAAGGNVAALLVMRASTRTREVAVRVALGAGQFRIARQAIIESALLGIAGALLGLIVAQLCLSIGKAAAWTEVPRLDAATIDVTALVFCALASAAWVLTFGTAPLWRRRSPQAGYLTAHLAIRATRPATMLRVMIVAQVTAAVVIVTAAGLLVRSFAHLSAIERGFNVRDLTVIRLLLPEALYPTPVARERLFDGLISNLTVLPGVAAATTVHMIPGTGQAGLSAPMMFEGQQPEEAQKNPFGTWEPIVPSYFETLRIPLRQGRSFTDADDGNAVPVAIVSESVAQQYWPEQNPIGKRVRLAPQFEWATVVGVVADTRYRQLTRAWLTVYFPAKQFFFYSPGALVVRTAAGSTNPLADVRRMIETVEPAAAVHSIDPMEKLVADETARPRAAVLIATLFAFTAILVSAIGVYGVFSYEVTHRARELAIRSAVGASPRQILVMTLRQSLAVGAVGAVLGLGSASLLTRYLTVLLFGVEPLDLATFAAAGLGLLAIVVFASLVPGRRAATVDPVLWLRAD